MDRDEVLIKLDLLPEECREVEAWFAAMLTGSAYRFANPMRHADIILWLAAFRATLAKDGRRTSLRMDPETALWLEHVVQSVLTGVNAPEPGSHRSRALGYLQNSIRHELARRGHRVPQHDPSKRIDTGLTYKPEQDQ